MNIVYSKGDAIISEFSDGSFKLEKFDDKNLIYRAIYNRVGKKIGETWFDYNEKGQMIHSKNMFGHEIWYEYGENDKVLRARDSNGFEAIFDEKCNIVSSNFS